MTAHDIDCQAAMERLWDFLDGELNEETMARVQSHLSACSCCHPHVEFSRRFLEALRRCREGGTMPSGVREKVMGCLKRDGLIT